MKIIALFCFTAVFLGCSDNSNFLTPSEVQEFRIIAYTSLTQVERDSLTSWTEAKVTQGKYLFKDDQHIVFFYSFSNSNHFSFILENSKFTLNDFQPLILVMFITRGSAASGPTMVVIDPDKNIAIGKVVRL